jgi:class 3 adenylate cyclase
MSKKKDVMNRNEDKTNSNFNSNLDVSSDYLKISNSDPFQLGSLQSNLHIGSTVFGSNPLQVSAYRGFNSEIFSSTNHLESEILRLRKEIQQLIESKEQSLEDIDRIKNVNHELERKLNLGSLISQVNSDAQTKLFKSDDFLNLFEKAKNCNTYVLSIDIRRSTELMLKAKKPELFEKFIVNLCDKLVTTILNNYGIFDKFTGDGVLAFFPDFFSGKDSGLLAIKTALECHEIFADHYKLNRDCFISILKEIGLGIGIDYGPTYLVKMNNSYTVIGSPVVYACRMSGAKAGDTLLNQNSFHDVFSKYRHFFNFHETSIDIKNEGETVAYKVISNGSDLNIFDKPDWDAEIQKLL